VVLSIRSIRNRSPWFSERTSLFLHGILTTGDVPDKAGYEMTLGARHRFSALGRAFRHQKAPSKSLYRPVLEIYIRRSTGHVGPTRLLFQRSRGRRGRSPSGNFSLPGFEDLIRTLSNDYTQYSLILRPRPISSARPESNSASREKVQRRRFQIVHRSGDFDHAFGLKFCQYRTLLANVGHRQLNVFLRHSVNIGAVLRR
jgi:hypothetical protein